MMIRASAVPLIVLVGILAGGVAGEGKVADERPRTLEDIYGISGDSFQAAIGFMTEEGTATNQANQSYGLAIYSSGEVGSELTGRGTSLDGPVQDPVESANEGRAPEGPAPWESNTLAVRARNST